MSSIQDALGRGDLQREAKAALRAQVGELLAEYSQMLTDLGTLRVPIHESEPGWWGDPPVAVEAFIVPWGGYLCLPYSPSVNWAVTPDGSWSTVLSKWRESRQGMATRYWAFQPGQARNDEGWVPAGLPISESFAKDIAEGTLYPGVSVVERVSVKECKRRGSPPRRWVEPLANMLAEHFRWHQENPKAVSPTEFRR